MWPSGHIKRVVGAGGKLNGASVREDISAVITVRLFRKCISNGIHKTMHCGRSRATRNPVISTRMTTSDWLHSPLLSPKFIL